MNSQRFEDSNSQFNEGHIHRNKESENEMGTPGILSRSESHRSAGTMLSSMDQGGLSAAKSSTETPISKYTGSNSNTKRSTFWGRKNVSLVCFLRNTTLN